MSHPTEISAGQASNKTIRSNGSGWGIFAIFAIGFVVAAIMGLLISFVLPFYGVFAVSNKLDQLRYETELIWLISLPAFVLVAAFYLWAAMGNRLAFVTGAVVLGSVNVATLIATKGCDSCGLPRTLSEMNAFEFWVFTILSPAFLAAILWVVRQLTKRILANR